MENKLMIMILIKLITLFPLCRKLTQGRKVADTRCYARQPLYIEHLRLKNLQVSLMAAGGLESDNIDFLSSLSTIDRHVQSERGND